MPKHSESNEPPSFLVSLNENITKVLSYRTLSFSAALSFDHEKIFNNGEAPMSRENIGQEIAASRRQ
jgi:hypothetical protein